MIMMTYEKAVAYIDEIPMFTKKHSLEHTKEFMRRLGNPEQGQKIIHVAGTNGKGSVCAYMQAMMMAEGKRAGFFTSPHLVKINERIQLNGVQIDDDTFLKVFCKVKDVVDEMGGHGIAHPSYFEFLFGMAMLAFAELAPDYIIMETGLGGRLDATNAVQHPILTIITSISLDHTQYLGDTISDIAMEKAGIIKEGSFLIYDGSSKEASAVIKKQAEKLHVPCREISKDAVRIREITGKHIAFSRVNAYDDNVLWTLSSSAVYQTMNASIAIAAMEKLHEGEFSSNLYCLWEKAVSEVTWEGRMEEVLPNVFIDGAHNPGAIEAFCESMELLQTEEKEHEFPVIMFSAVADKKYDDMIAMLCERVPAKAYILTEIEDARRVPLSQLKDTFGKYTDCPVYAERDVCKAWNKAMSLKTENGKMYCLGSLYLVGMIKDKILTDNESSYGQGGR